MFKKIREIIAESRAQRLEKSLLSSIEKVSESTKADWVSSVAGDRFRDLMLSLVRLEKYSSTGSDRVDTEAKQRTARLGHMSVADLPLTEYSQRLEIISRLSRKEQIRLGTVSSKEKQSAAFRSILLADNPYRAAFIHKY